MEEKELSEKESPALITNMISKARDHYYESNFRRCINTFKPFIIGGIARWILGIISFRYQSYFSYLFVALGAGIARIIPGFILIKRIYKNIANQNNGF